ncbi:E3 ubiquitin-protein ligase Iruka-like [Daktulosphaira vitifoliae]|uniref:E3 ubiquitin-protein ligase Iruka-like n=1 Tax=Daktulosphaira vitifoliae TaxID=58002 RepID=UPI0021AAB270|nr:E3 ubiquitin-protein ligase Iruka-like [Daktulosphaira vitifoliae]
MGKGLPVLHLVVGGGDGTSNVEGTVGDSSSVCPICLDELNIEIHVTTCIHTFCKGCIKKWIKIHGTCPICRSSINYETDGTSSESSDSTSSEDETMQTTMRSREGGVVFHFIPAADGVNLSPVSPAADNGDESSSDAGNGSDSSSETDGTSSENSW